MGGRNWERNLRNDTPKLGEKLSMIVWGNDRTNLLRLYRSGKDYDK